MMLATVIASIDMELAWHWSDMETLRLVLATALHRIHQLEDELSTERDELSDSEDRYDWLLARCGGTAPE
jgi:hypothetical protein